MVNTLYTIRFREVSGLRASATIFKIRPLVAEILHIVWRDILSSATLCGRCGVCWRYRRVTLYFMHTAGLLLLLANVVQSQSILFSRWLWHHVSEMGFCPVTCSACLRYQQWFGKYDKSEIFITSSNYCTQLTLNCAKVCTNRNELVRN